MIVKILSSSPDFPGVRYNTNKVDKQSGELMTVKNFDLLKGLDHLSPSDYRNYLTSISKRNKQVKNPQFHAVISCKGKSKDKMELTQIAESWLTEMGYGNNPYMIIYHKDTDNNHVHIVSTRIDKQGKKISDSFEKNRAVAILNRVMGEDVHLQAARDVERSMTYNVSSKAQFSMLLERQGYLTKMSDGQLDLIKYGKNLLKVAEAAIEKRINDYKAPDTRIRQLKVIFEKYKKVYNTSLTPVYDSLPGRRNRETTCYTSAFSEAMKEKFGLDLVFHFKGERSPYGYTVIDHAKKNVIKGGSLMPLKVLLSRQDNVAVEKAKGGFVRDPIRNNQGWGNFKGAHDRNGYHIDGNVMSVPARNEVLVLFKEESRIKVNSDRVEEADRFLTPDRKAAQTLAFYLGTNENSIRIDLSPSQKRFYAFLLKGIVHDYPTVKEGLKEQGLSIFRYDDCTYLIDRENGVMVDVKKLFAHERSGASQDLEQSLTNPDILPSDGFDDFFSSISLSDDIDDEQIIGMKRRRKQKARKNTR